jgi:hypothetical protein
MGRDGGNLNFIQIYDSGRFQLKIGTAVQISTYELVKKFNF